MNNYRGIIVAMYPGMGKTTIYNDESYNGIFSMSDSDSSAFSKLNDGSPNPDFPNNYISHIKDLICEKDIVFVSTHKIVLEALARENLPVIVVFPRWDYKEEYCERFLKRTTGISGSKFYDLMISNWDAFHRDLYTKRDNQILVDYKINEWDQHPKREWLNIQLKEIFDGATTEFFNGPTNEIRDYSNMKCVGFLGRLLAADNQN